MSRLQAVLWLVAVLVWQPGFAQQGKPKVPPELPPQASDKAQQKVAEHTAPAVTLTAPATSALYTAPAAVQLQASAAASSAGRSITQVEFFAGTTLLGTAITAPYSLAWNNVAAGAYSLTAKATDNLGVASTSSPVAIIVNTPPSVSLTSPGGNATFTAPATIPLSVQANDVDGTIARVEFYNGANLIGALTQPPFSTDWLLVPAGSYSLSARVTDNLGATAVSETVSVTVNQAVAQIYYIHSDHLNTPRAIYNQQQQLVWRWDNSDPFGGNVPVENPSGLGAFTCNLRLPGQYFDRETSLHYNHFRDYDPVIGRYGQSDPIGLDGGINTYGYVGGNPIRFSDPSGLRSAWPWVAPPGMIPNLTPPNPLADCGPEGGTISNVIPNNPFGFPFQICCDAHDKCYSDCKGPNQLGCDADGCNCFSGKCKTYVGMTRATCQRTAQEYCYRMMYSQTAVEQFRKAREKCSKTGVC